MNTETGEILQLLELSKEQKESGKWIPIPKKYEEKLKGMNRKQRREFLRKEGCFKKGKWGFLK